MIPKFRAWDKEENKMRNNVNVITNENGTLEALILKYEFNGYDFTELEVIEYDSVYFYTQDEFPYTIMQSTGLIDVNGVEIFEGDIVKVTDDDESTDFSDGGIGTICGLDELYMWYIDGQVHNGLFDINQSYYIEVLGNIHENPELLETT